MDFDDNKVLKEELGILKYVQVCRFIKLKVYSELTLLEAFIDKLNVSDSDGTKSDEYEGSASEGSDFNHDTSASGYSLDSGDLNLKCSGSGMYCVPITNLACECQTWVKVN